MVVVTVGENTGLGTCLAISVIFRMNKSVRCVFKEKRHGCGGVFGERHDSPSAHISEASKIQTEREQIQADGLSVN